MRKLAAVLLAVALGVGPAAAAPPPWLEIKSRHFTVVTNAGEKSGRRAAWQMEQIRQALKLLWPWANIDGGLPITIFAARDEATLKTLGPQYWEGKRFRPASFWATGVDRQYIALRTDLAEPNDEGDNPYQTAYWNYVSLVFHRSLPPGTPEWYSRGVTEVLSNTIVREKEIHVGRLMDHHLRRMRESPHIPLAEFLAVTRGSKYLTREADAWQFEAQAWAFVHYLMFGNRGQHSGRVNRYNDLLLQGVAPDVAQKEAFGPDMTPYFLGMREYLSKSIFQYSRIPTALDLKAEGFSSRPLSPAESTVERAYLLAAMGRPVESRAVLAEGSKAEPAHPGPYEVEGLLLDREQKPAEALAAFGKAVELGSKRAQVFYRVAQLTRPATGADEPTNEKIAALLERALLLDPQSARAMSYLADIRSDLGQADVAVDLAQKAVKIEPESMYHRLALARALWSARRADEAVAAARSAMSAAESDQERGYAQRFLDFAARATRPAAPSQPATATPAASPGTDRAAAGAPTPVRLVGAAKVMSECFASRDDASCAEALPLLKDSCDQKDGQACRALGSLYDGGFGAPMDKVKAGAAYDTGCRIASDPGSCARYAVLQVQGLGVQRDSAAGLATLERLCGEKVDDACIGWALILAARPEKPDVPKARQLLTASCEARNEEACRLLKAMPAR